MFFFFFQAEDGIRDSSVTGVQTCALPIYLRVLEKGDGVDPPPARHCVERFPQRARHETRGHEARDPPPFTPGDVAEQGVLGIARSEERRVGKAGRWGWGRGDCWETSEARE